MSTYGSLAPKWLRRFMNVLLVLTYLLTYLLIWPVVGVAACYSFIIASYRVAWQSCRRTFNCQISASARLLASDRGGFRGDWLGA